MIIIILLICFLLFNYTENFTIFNPVNENTPNGYYNFNKFFEILFPSDKNTTSIYENRFKFIPSTINNKTENTTNNIKCCLVKKKLVNNHFEYEYKKYDGQQCNFNNFVLDHNNQLLIEGINNWDNSECRDDSTILGACKHYNFECVDFVDKDTCDKYNDQMPPDPLNRKIAFTWSNTPCYSRS